MVKAATTTKEKEQESIDRLAPDNDTNKTTKKSEKKGTATNTTTTPEKKKSKATKTEESTETPTPEESDTPPASKAEKASPAEQAEDVQLNCQQEKLREQLNLVKLATPSKPTHAILGNVLIIADEKTQKVTLRVFDLNLGIETKFNTKVIKSGELTLPVGLLTDIVGHFNRETGINLNTAVDKEGQPTATLNAETGYYQLKGMPSKEFPPFPCVDFASTLNISIELIKDAIKRTSFAASSEETKQILTGVHIKAEQDTVEFAATDGHRLSFVSAKCLSGSKITSPFKFTCPSKTLIQLERMLSMLSDETNGSTPSANVGINCSSEEDESDGFEFSFGNTRLVGRYLAGAYPNYPELLKQKINHKIVLEKAVIIKALERISVLANTDKTDKIVKIEFKTKEQQAQISIARNFGKGIETVPAHILEGGNITIGFNLKFLLDGIKNMPSTEIQMGLTTSTGPGIITAFGNRENPTLTIETKYLLMPVEFGQ